MSTAKKCFDECYKMLQKEPLCHRRELKGYLEPIDSTLIYGNKQNKSLH